MKKSVNQELNKRQKQLGFPSGDALFKDYSRCDGINSNGDYNTSLISGLINALTSFSEPQKRLIYEQLIKSGFTP
ncbi:MAG: hypothetical protein ACK53Q_06335 [Dolichospermum sp.]|jgi:hypothetical protein